MAILKTRLCRYFTLAVLALMAGIPAHVFAWSTVGEGIEYEHYVLPDPNRVYVARMLRSSVSATIESSMAQGKLSGATETVRSQASRYNGAINDWDYDWGQRNKVVIAINGDWFVSPGVVYSGQVHSGWYSKEIYCQYGGSQFAWRYDRTPFIGACTWNTSQNLAVKFVSSGAVQSCQGLNRSRGTDELIIYTPQYDDTTKTDNSGVEVLVEMDSPTGLTAASGPVFGHVLEIRQGQGSTPIPFDYIVLSATGARAAALLANISVGSRLEISQGVTAYEYPNCSTPLAFDWSGTYASIGGGHVLVYNSAVIDNSADPVQSARHPRTAVAYDSNYVYFIVCDGRSSASRGMTGMELGGFCRNTLGATYALNLDGGGSSAMVVNGAVMNVPSDGAERAVGNGLMMVNVLPRYQSDDFCAGQYVWTTAGTNVRLGPGTNYGVSTSVSLGTVGTVAEHRMRGISAKGYYWYKVNFSGAVGWVAESLLGAYGSIQPSITAHPSPVTTCTGQSATFSISATGSGTLSYRWQRNSVDLTDGGHYSGVASRQLSIQSAAADDAGNYRCVVTSPYGSATSNAAALALNPSISISISEPSVPYTRTTSVTYAVTYANADIVTLTTSNVTLTKTGTAVAAYSVSGSGNFFRTITLSSFRGHGTVAVTIAAGTAVGCGSAPSAGPSVAVLVDSTAPGSVNVTDQGTWTPSLTTLKASWNAAADTGSGVSSYLYAVGTTQSTADVKIWTPHPSTTIEDSSLSLQEGTRYYVLVRAVDNVGLLGPISSSDGITVAPDAGKIGTVWSKEDGVGLALRDKTVICAGPGAFWLEEQDRTAGIEVLSPSVVAVGNRVSVAGTLGIFRSHRVLNGDIVDNFGGATAIRPLGMVMHGFGSGAFHTIGLLGSDHIQQLKRSR